MTDATLQAACLQLTPGDDLGANLDAIGGLVAEAAGSGAELVALPEYCTFLVRSSRRMGESAETEGASVALAWMRDLARGHEVWLLVGSLLIREEGRDRPFNRSFLLSPQGEVVARYDKIHMFDVTLGDGRRIKESDHYASGDAAVVAPTPFGALGLSICYDLRFPHLFRSLAQAGADILTVPSAFSAQTGPAHWEPLLRARAIETGAYVLAPATVGEHPGDWRTHGHAMIVDPWGAVLAERCDDRPGVATATLDLARVAVARASIPSLTTEAAFAAPVSTHP